MLASAAESVVARAAKARPSTRRTPQGFTLMIAPLPGMSFLTRPNFFRYLLARALFLATVLAPLAEADLSLPAAPDCIEGVPKGSPDGTRVLLFRACAGEPWGVTLTDAAGSYRTWIAEGFGADWNPAAK